MLRTPSTVREAKESTADRADHAWVVRLMEKEGGGLLRLLWRLLGHEADVMDAFQDCFCKLAQRGGESGLSNARAYLYRTASNVAVELLRGRERRRQRIENTDEAGAKVTGKDRQELSAFDDRTERLRHAIATLPTYLRNVIVLRDISGLDYSEVSKTLGIDAATARVYRRHAVIRLAELMVEGAKS